jgi:hypothetical protein
MPESNTQGATRKEYISTDEPVKCPNCGKKAYGPGTDRTAKQVLTTDEQRASICLTLDGNFIHTTEQLAAPTEGEIITPDRLDVSNTRLDARIDGQDVVVEATELEVVNVLDD